MSRTLVPYMYSGRKPNNVLDYSSGFGKLKKTEQREVHARLIFLKNRFQDALKTP